MSTQKIALFNAIKEIVIQSRNQVYTTVNTVRLKMYWEIGKLILEDEQSGQERAKYGKAILKSLSLNLSREFGSGFDERNLNNMRAFFRAYPIWNAVRTELSWTHYRILCRIENQSLMLQYTNEAITENWNTRILQRNIDSQYLGRLLSVPEEVESKPQVQQFVRDPYIFEFLGIPRNEKLSESALETALISHIQTFLMELGKGFAFVARQQHIVTETSDFFIDLVFYNYFLKCFVLIDLKTTNSPIRQWDKWICMLECSMI